MNLVEKLKDLSRKIVLAHVNLNEGNSLTFKKRIDALKKEYKQNLILFYGNSDIL